MSNESILKAIENSNYSKKEQLAAEMREILALKVDRNIKGALKETTDRLIEILEGGRNREVAKIVRSIRGIVQPIIDVLNGKEASNEWPKDIPTMEYLLAFEMGAGKKIEEMRTNDSQDVEFFLDSIPVNRKPHTLFTIVARGLFGTQEIAKGKQACIAIRNGEKLNEVKRLVEQANEVNRDYLLAFEDGTHQKLEEMSLKDYKKYIFFIGKIQLKRSPATIFEAIAKKVLNSKELPKGKKICIFLRDGKTIEEAKGLIEGIDSAKLINREYLTSFEKGAGRKLEEISINGDNKISFFIGPVNLERTPNSLFLWIAINILNCKEKAKAKQFCIYVRDGKTFDEAKMLAQEGSSRIEDEEFEKLSTLKLEEAIALLQDDPLKLKRYLQFAHPELSPDDVNKLVTTTFTGLHPDYLESRENKYLKWKEKIARPTLDPVPRQTTENMIILSGKASDCTHVFIAGVYTRRKKVEDDGTFSITVPLQVGKLNKMRIMSLDITNEKRSPQVFSEVEQKGKPDDTKALVKLLSDLGTQVRKDIQQDPGRMRYLQQSMEQSLIKKFGQRFSNGESYVRTLMADPTTSPTMRQVLQFVLRKFTKIQSMEMPGIISEDSFKFFQKYCVADIRRRIEEGLPGVILANDPGTGKTRIVQGATADMHTTVISPNAVVAAWDSEGGKVLENANVTALHGVASTIRKERLRTIQKLKITLDTPQHIYTNRDFLREIGDEERFKLLSDTQTIVVEDEAHSRHSEQSFQTKGAQKLRTFFRILVTATPSKDPKTFRRMMAIFKPKDKRFSSDVSFTKAFPGNDPKALKTLNLLQEEFTIRFRKEDVMEAVDPKRSLSQQTDRLPSKEFIPEDESVFTMSTEQAESIYEIFTDWQGWCERNNKYIPKDQTAHEDGLRTSSGFAKKHAMRQVINNPHYINSSKQDLKLKKTREWVEKFLAEGRKVVIFCAYQSQAEKYEQDFADLNPAVYTGKTGKKKDLRCVKGETEESKSDWVLDENNYPIEDENGEQMSALEYERVTFQNTDDRRLLIATYDAGAVGTTFTAGKAMILDDCPRDCIEEIQAEDRIHRIDPDRLTHAEVKYVKLQSRYPKSFIESVKKRWLVRIKDEYSEFSTQKEAEDYIEHLEELKQTSSDLVLGDPEILNAYEHFFANGTYDRVQTTNLRTQRLRFHLINDGIEDKSALQKGDKSFPGI